MNQILTIEYKDDQFCALRYKYNRRFSDFIQRGISNNYRRFNNVEKCWYVHNSKLSYAVAFGKRFFTHVDYSSLPDTLQIEIVQFLRERGGNDSSSLSRPSPAFEVLHLLPSAPPEVVKAAYKALAVLHHPDRGGDTEEFRQIQEAYEKLID